VVLLHENTVHYPCRRHPAVNVFRELDQCLRETRDAIPAIQVNADRRGNVANEDAVISGSEREPRRSLCHIASELGLTQPKSPSTFVTIHCIHTTARGSHVPFQTMFFYGCNYANGYDINTLRISFSFLHTILWTCEACFRREGVFNIYNSHILGRDSPHDMRKQG
jgi:hypothetical protein